MATTVKIEGLRELDRALAEIPKATGKAALRRVLKNRAEPIAADARGKVRVDEGDLRDSIGVGTKLTSRQAGQHRKMFKDDRASVEMFVGAGGLVQAITEEFGTSEQSPHPFMRPAWDANRHTILEGLKADLWNEVHKWAARHARKLAKLAKG